MDPVSHSVLGRLVTEAASRNGVPARGIGAASILGALSPDVDFVLMPMGWDIYLRAHEIGTHSVIGLIVTGLGSAGIVRAFVRESRYGALAAAAVAGAASHVAADIVSGARLRPAWPFLDAIVSVPLVAMADPWPIAILLAGAVLLWRTTRYRIRAARQVLAVLVAFLGVKAVLLSRALDATLPASLPSARVVEARWGSLTEWHLFDRTDDAVRQWRVDATGREPRLLLSWPVALDSPLIQATRRLDTVRNFLDVHHLVFAVERPAAGTRLAVLWSDIRFCWKPVTGAEPIACGLWFGGILEPDGRVVRQQVRVGSWIQNRPAP